MSGMHALLKIAAIAAGLVGTFLSLMGLIGAVTESGYARAIGAGLLTLAVPVIIADRLLPKDDQQRAKGLVSDVFAVWLLGFAVLFTTAGHQATRPLLTREGDRLQSSGWANLASVTYFLAGVTPGAPPAAAGPDPAASAATSASAGPVDGGIEDAGAADASAEQDAAVDAGGKVPEARPDRSPAQLFQELAPSVVTIFVKSSGREGGGTGFFLDAEGTLATNHHVIVGADVVQIKFKSGVVFDKVELLAADPAADLALLRIDPAQAVDGGAPQVPVPVLLADSDLIVVGERAISIGNPLGFEHTLTDGLVSARRLHEGRQWIQMSVPVSPGNSGGPLFNMRGEVIGVTTAQLGMFARAQNLNLAVPVNDLKRLIRPSYPQRRKFGDASSPSQW